MNKSILIIGACGQIGTELTLKLREINGEKTVIASDIREGNKELMKSGPFEFVNALDYNSILKIIEKYQVNEVYLMAAMLSATGEKFPAKAWELNMNSLFNSHQSLDQLASSDAFGLVLTQQAEEADDQSDSIMKFLFEGNDTSSGKLKSQSQSVNDLSFHTMNPFAK